MSSPAKIKVIALGTATTIIRLGTFAAGSDLEITGFTQLSGVTECLHHEEYDAILVDSQHADAESACRYLLEVSNVPVALLIRAKDADWQSYSSWMVDGFIAEESSNTEMAARIIALARRYHKVPA